MWKKKKKTTDCRIAGRAQTSKCHWHGRGHRVSCSVCCMRTYSVHTDHTYTPIKSLQIEPNRVYISMCIYSHDASLLVLRTLFVRISLNSYTRCTLCVLTSPILVRKIVVFLPEIFPGKHHELCRVVRTKFWLWCQEINALYRLP